MAMAYIQETVLQLKIAQGLSIVTYIWVNNGSDNGLWLEGTDPVPEQVLIYL